MRLEDLERGKLYRLTRDVKNPAPDRRVKYQSFAHVEVVPAGTLVRTRCWIEERRDGTVTCREFSGVTIEGSVNLGNNPGLFDLILTWLEPHDENVATLFEREGHGYTKEVLAWLVANGFLTVARIEGIIDELREHEDETDYPQAIRDQLTLRGPRDTEQP